MLIVNENCADYFGTVVANAVKMGPAALNNLLGRLTYLSEYGCRRDGSDRLDMRLARCILMKDFSPNSFTFSIQKLDRETREYRHWMQGGLIYSGPGVDKDDRGPVLTTSLDPKMIEDDTHTWSTHT